MPSFETILPRKYKLLQKNTAKKLATRSSQLLQVEMRFQRLEQTKL